MSLEGKVAIVTGAARGLGRDYARSFAAEGVSVVIADVLGDLAEETAADIRKSGGKALAVSVDVADVSSTRAMADRAAETFGRLDILVNNAAVWGDLESSPMIQVKPDYWDKVMAVNLKGPLLCAQACAPHMQRNKWGRIVNITSMGALMRGGPYGTSKLALNHMTFTLAHELGGDGITVNAVGPGATYNEATRTQVPEQIFQLLIAQQSVKRPGQSSDFYGAIRYLCSDAAEWVTGQTLYVNGGFNTSF